MKLKLGTRGSDLARAQSTWVASQLEAQGLGVELVVISTAGDRSTAPSFGDIGPQGVFVREIEQALMDHSIDIAVHSYKDLPTRSPDGLVVAAVPARQDAADFLIARSEAIDPQAAEPLLLMPGQTVGTSSARRAAWIGHFRTDLKVAPLRGNVPTRIKRLRAGDYDAILLASAGIARLEAGSDALSGLLDDLELIRLDPSEFVAAPAQGALAVQCRRDDEDLRASLAALDDEPTRVAVDVERDVLMRAEGGCDAAFGAFCRWTENPAADAGGYELALMGDFDGRVERVSLRADVVQGFGERAWEAFCQSARKSA